jgi:DNA-directed RNA polymerase specialized sigma24 family protein
MELVKKYTDEELVAALQSGRELNAAVRFLYDQYFGHLRGYILQNQGSRQDAEETFQEVVVTFIELVRLKKFQAGPSIETFLTALNRQIWLQELIHRGGETPFLPLEETKQHPDVSHYIAGRESRKQIMDMVERLEDSGKKILLAWYYEKAPMKQLLKISGVEDEQALRNKKSKSLRQLEQMLTANPAMAKTLKSALHYER